MSNSNNGISPFGWLIIFAVACAVLGQFFGSNNGGTSSAPTATSSSSSAERRYVEQRFKQEGYSSSDAATAAEAVLKFQRAQDARRNR
jgi:hypothetical protein